MTTRKTADSTDEPGTTPFCFATVVLDKALESLLASGAAARIKDEHPWLVAQRDFLRAQDRQLRVPLLLARQLSTRRQAMTHDATSQQCEFSHWGYIRSIDVLELSGKRYLTEVRLGPLSEVSPLFAALDSVCVKPSEEQLLREKVEFVRTQRVPLTEQCLRPYAICESPGFIPRLTPWLFPKPEV